MNANEANAKQLNNLVARTLQSGVKPFEMILEPVYDCYYGEAEAYRVSLAVNSIISGRLAPEDYLRGGSDGKLLADVSLRALKKALALKKTLEAKSETDDGSTVSGNATNIDSTNINPINVKAIFVRCATALFSEPELYSRIRAVLKSENADGEGVYLEFFPEAFEAETDALKGAFGDIRAAGLKVAIDGYGGENFPIEKLLAVCPDAVFSDGKLPKLVTDREKSAAVAPLINLVKGLGGKVIAENVENDEELREFRTRECFGFIPSANYSGSFGKLGKQITADKLTNFAEERAEESIEEATEKLTEELTEEGG